MPFTGKVFYLSITGLHFDESSYLKMPFRRMLEYLLHAWAYNKDQEEKANAKRPTNRR